MRRILIIGGGPGGTPAAMALAKSGQQVTLVEQGAGLGGTCLFEGCIPSKIFREAARRMREIRESLDFGLCLPNQELHLDWASVQARKHAILRRRSDAAKMQVQRLPNLKLISGHASFLSPRSAKIVTGQGDEQIVEFDQAIISTGSTPLRPPIPGVNHHRVLDSEAILDIQQIPESLLIVGAGPIGVELGQMMNTFGSQVTILEVAHHILGPVDASLSALLQEQMQADGIDIKTECQVTAILNTADGVHVEYTTSNGHKTHQFANNVLLVTGRRPHIEGLGLAKTVVQYNAHGIKVDEHCETHEPGIFAVGDVIGQPMFAHWATTQSLALARHIIGMPVIFPQPEHNSAVIFSEPELGMVGLTEEQAKAKGIDAAITSYDYSQDARAQISGRDFGLLKLVYDRKTHQVVGVHALVEGADDLMGEAAILVSSGITLEALASAIHPHPTLSESFAQAARMVLSSPQ